MDTHDCLIVGGGAAGLSAALVLGRARRRTLLVDAGDQSNLPAHGIGGLLGHDRRAPADLYALGHDELAHYPTVEARTGTVTELRPANGDDVGFEATLADGSTVRARTVLLATGMTYRFPDKTGLAERWGRSVFHCPFCHGWEVRERPLAVLDPGPFGAMRAQLLSAWSDDVTLLTDGTTSLSEEDRDLLRSRSISLDERPVAGVTGGDDPDDLHAVRFAEGPDRPCGGLLVATTLAQRSPLAQQLGLEVAPATLLTSEGLVVTPMGQTSVPGVFAAGDSTGANPSVANVVAAGAAAAAGVVHDLVIAPPR